MKEDVDSLKQDWFIGNRFRRLGIGLREGRRLGGKWMEIGTLVTKSLKLNI